MQVFGRKLFASAWTLMVPHSLLSSQSRRASVDGELGTLGTHDGSDLLHIPQLSLHPVHTDLLHILGSSRKGQDLESLLKNQSWEVFFRLFAVSGSIDRLFSLTVLN